MNYDSFTLDGIFYSVADLKILRGAYLQFKCGEICALFGKNGSGKSTLLKIAAGQIVPDSGITIIDGHRYSKALIRHRFSSIAYLPQESMLPNDIKVGQLLKSFDIKTSVAQDPILGKIVNQKVSNLSGGERRYLEIVLVFSLNRRYVLLDEPFTGIEPIIIERITNLISLEAKKGCGILISDHYHHYVVNLADSAYLLRNGQCYFIEGELRSSLLEMGYIK